ncbi:hypothetical protein C2G38_2046285 [Gigaspora rosea]|uniref:SWIM-type domain-containing protein n=1 Tax=Gigaspora rosea TaxID=44941 RepID=A0A397U9W7_9GLOM|nr:hypothetical protein C2G38_2046285 [Gigaspora rosea]
MWGVQRVISNEIQHFVILLNDGAHLCSCFAHCNREIVCRYYFQVMLCTRAATFHIQLIRLQWYNETSSNSAQDPFLVAQKFEMEQLVTMGYKPQTINERKLYGEACGKARVALAVAVRRRDYNFIAILDKYLDDCQEVLSSNSDSNAFSDNEIEAGSNISNEKLDPKELTNPYKRKARGRPK